MQHYWSIWKVFCKMQLNNKPPWHLYLFLTAPHPHEQRANTWRAIYLHLSNPAALTSQIFSRNHNNLRERKEIRKIWQKSNALPPPRHHHLPLKPQTRPAATVCCHRGFVCPHQHLWVKPVRLVSSPTEGRPQPSHLPQWFHVYAGNPPTENCCLKPLCSFRFMVS